TRPTPPVPRRLRTPPQATTPVPLPPPPIPIPISISIPNPDHDPEEHTRTLGRGQPGPALAGRAADPGRGHRGPGHGRAAADAEVLLGVHRAQVAGHHRARADAAAAGLAPVRRRRAARRGYAALAGDGGLGHALVAVCAGAGDAAVGLAL